MKLFAQIIVLALLLGSFLGSFAQIKVAYANTIFEGAFIQLANTDNLNTQKDDDEEEEEEDDDC